MNWATDGEPPVALDHAVEDYSPDIYRQKCAAVFEHVYESYPERDRGVYATAM